MLRNQIDVLVLSARLTRKLYTEKKKRLKEVSRCMACTVERLRQAARNVPVVLLLGRLKNEGLDPQSTNPVTWRPPTQLGEERTLPSPPAKGKREASSSRRSSRTESP